MRHKNIPGGDSVNNTDPNYFPQHGYVIIIDTKTGQQWISRGGPGGEEGNSVFGSVKGVTTLDVAGSTLDHGAIVNESSIVYTSYESPDKTLATLRTYTDAVNAAKVSYNPLARNSNSFAYGAVEALTGSRPVRDVWAPAAQTNLLEKDDD